MVVCCFTHGRQEEKGEEEADAGGGCIKVHSITDLFQNQV